MTREQEAYFKTFPTAPRKGERRKLEILQAAVHSLAKEGFAGSTFDHVAKTLGVRRSHIAYYFKDREDLLEAVVKYVATVAQTVTLETVEIAKTAEDKIMAISDGAFIWARKYPEQAKVVLLFYYLCTYEKRFQKLQAHIREAGHQRIRALLATFAKGSEPELDELAKALQGVMTGLVVEQCTVGPGLPGMDFQRLSRQACMGLLGTPRIKSSQ